MLGTLYLITNDVNDLKYVGKTYENLNNRWKEHLSDSKRFPNRSLYKAINDIGSSHFNIEPIGYYPEEVLEDLEIETIANFNSFINGYNDTSGGEGRRTLLVTDEEIITEFNKTKNVTNTARVLKIDAGSVNKVLLSYDIKSRNPGCANGKRVKIVGLDKIFPNMLACADYIIENNYTKTNRNAVASGIGKAAAKTRKTYAKLEFEFV
jgi:hypothetical protein